jgi:cell division protein FtsI (penicillin-binding protein 3)
MHRSNSAFGYGMTLTFAQLLKAYSAFNNGGIAMTPRIVGYLGDGKGKRYTLEPKIADITAISTKAANEIHNILLKVVKRGTGKEAQTVGLEIGGKTGTAHIAKNGRYTREYHSSFYGFANDKKGNKYTIGVLVIKAKKKYKYFASKSAVPTFKNIVTILANQNYLIPDKRAVEAYEKRQKKLHPKAWKKKKSDIKSLFKLKKKPVVKKPIQRKLTKPKPRTPIIKQSASDLFEDMF